MQFNTSKSFWSHVDIRKPNECWIWQGVCQPNGYGRYQWLGKQRFTHRIAYSLAHPKWRWTKHVCHSCDTPNCVNPAHLWNGTQADNLADMSAKGRRVVLRGENSVLARLTNAKVAAILRSRLSNRKLASKYKVGVGTVQAVREGRSWQHVSGKRGSPRPRLTPNEVLAIRADRRPHKVIAAEYKMNTRVIGAIQTGRHWKHLPGIRQPWKHI